MLKARDNSFALSVPPICPPVQTSPPYDTPSEIDEVVLIAGKLTPKIFPTYNFTLRKYRPAMATFTFGLERCLPLELGVGHFLI